MGDSYLRGVSVVMFALFACGAAEEGDGAVNGSGGAAETGAAGSGAFGGFQADALRSSCESSCGLGSVLGRLPCEPGQLVVGGRLLGYGGAGGTSMEESDLDEACVSDCVRRGEKLTPSCLEGYIADGECIADSVWTCDDTGMAWDGRGCKSVPAKLCPTP